MRTDEYRNHIAFLPFKRDNRGMDVRLVSPIRQDLHTRDLSMLVEHDGNVLIWNFGRYVFDLLRRVDDHYGGLHVGPAWWAAGLARNCLLEGEDELAWMFLVIAAAGLGEFDNPRLRVYVEQDGWARNNPRLNVQYLAGGRP